MDGYSKFWKFRNSVNLSEIIPLFGESAHVADQATCASRCSWVNIHVLSGSSPASFHFLVRVNGHMLKCLVLQCEEHIAYQSTCASHCGFYANMQAIRVLPLGHHATVFNVLIETAKVLGAAVGNTCCRPTDMCFPLWFFNWHV